MQIATRKIAMIALVLLLSAACSTGGSGKTTWVDLIEGQVTPSDSSRIERGDIYQLSPSDEALASEWLQNQNLSVVALKDFPGQLMVTNENKVADDPSNVYLLRAVSDSTPGSFTAYAGDAGVLVLYNHFGYCGKLERRVVAIRLKNRPLKVFAGCSAAL